MYADRAYRPVAPRTGARVAGVKYTPARRAVQQLERELKLDVGEGWSFPDLTGVLPGVRAVRLPTLDLLTTYYDTGDLRLARQHVTLRHRATQLTRGPGRRSGGRTDGEAVRWSGAGEWTVKLPLTTDGALLTRTEVTWPAKELGTLVTGGSRRRGANVSTRPAPIEPSEGPAWPPVHPEAARLVRGLCLGLRLRPVARLSTVRQRVELRTSDGHALAEVDYDTVSGDRLIAPRGTTRFCEVEVELAPGSAAEVLDAAFSRLVAAGARPGSRVSKLAAIIGTGKPAPSDGTARALSAGGPTLEELVWDQVLGCLQVLLAHDPAIRLDDPDPEHVHRARVATRRLRSVLRVLGGSYQPAQTELPQTELPQLHEELRWLAGLFGRVRNADVREELLRADGAGLAPTDSPGVASLLVAAEAERRRAHDEMREALNGHRYLALLKTLEEFNPLAPASGSVGPRSVVADAKGVAGAKGEGSAPLATRGGAPALDVLPALVRRCLRSLQREVKGLSRHPTNEELHRVRIKAKRLRYTAELAAGLPSARSRLRRAGALPGRRPAPRGKAHKAIAKAATALQDVLGQLHDAVEAEAWLRQTAGTCAADGWGPGARDEPKIEKGSRARPGQAGAAGQAEQAAQLVLVAGQLVAAARLRQERHRAAWPRDWKRLKRVCGL
jgi:CHAD domain-containing protein